PEPALVPVASAPKVPAAPATATHAPEAGRSRPSETTVRLSTAKLDALMEVVGELQAARLAAEQRLAALRSLLESAESWAALSRAVRQHTRRLRLEAASTDPGEPARDEAEARWRSAEVSALLSFVEDNDGRLRA